MSEFRVGYDVVIAGAGPAGIAAAASLAERGAEVLLLEAEPGAARRLAGEWL
ncbi:MAG: NAD(P)/FAD-dependent oxidoreductase, partial [Polyangiaceae bacterium]|nr:NAD(P)/FAD-dependent oxidoreductase [Polyangiaceae bacterium]